MSNTIQIRNLTIGKGFSKICVPIIGRTKVEVLKHARAVIDMKADMIEWRADYFDSGDYPAIVSTLSELRKKIGEMPLIFTFRTQREGGRKTISNKEYTELLDLVATLRCADLIDVEVISKFDVAPRIIKSLKSRGTKIIASYHNFYSTPARKDIFAKLKQMEDLGADICKIAVTPQRMSDVDVLMKATRDFYEIGKVPVVTMSMTDMGSISRISGNTTGSAITFAAGVGSSAPGQLSVKQIRNIYESVWQIHFDYNIMLIGFMGAGKTTVSAALRNITGFEEIDVDQYIVKKEGSPISNIFETRGEQYFRDKETEALMDIQKYRGMIVSCGGGATLRDENVNLMKRGGVIVLLTATPETIFERVRHSSSRPVLNGNMTVEHITELMSKRKDRYLNVADIVVATDSKSIVQICEEILSKLLKYGKNS